jgi:hypothetical protein
MAEIGYEVKAVRTEYAGTVFNSRLEAHWAAFFDVVGWPWLYQPFDLDGWSPDFMLQPVHMGREKSGVLKPDFEQSNPILVEVRPIDRFCVETGHRMSNALFKSENKLEPLLLGLSPQFNTPQEDQDETSFGWLGEFFEEHLTEHEAESLYPSDHPTGSYSFDKALLRPAREIPGNTEIKADFCHATQSYRFRISGYYDGSQGGGLHREVCRRYWGMASSLVEKGSWEGPANPYSPRRYPEESLDKIW